MANDINSVFLIGRLTKDPELRYTQNGATLCNFTIAVNRKIKDKEEVSYFDIVTFGKLAEIINQYQEKGNQIAILGRLQQRRWEDQNGQKHSKVEIFADNVQFLGSGKQSTTQEEASQTVNQSFDAPYPEDDDIPF